MNIKWDELPRKAQVATIRYTTDTNLLSEILKDETIDLGLKSVIAYNSITTDEILSELVGLSVFSDTNKYGELMEVIANHPNASPNTRHKITEKNFEGYKLFQILAHREDTLDKTLLSMLKKLDKYAVWDVVSHPNMPQDKLDELADFARYREWVAANRSTDDKTFRKLAKVKDYSTTVHLAWNPSLPDDVFNEIAQYPVAWEGLLWNQNTPKEALDSLFDKLYAIYSNTGKGNSIRNVKLYMYNDKKICERTIDLCFTVYFSRIVDHPNTSKEVITKVYDAGFYVTPEKRPYCKKNDV